MTVQRQRVRARRASADAIMPGEPLTPAREDFVASRAHHGAIDHCNFGKRLDGVRCGEVAPGKPSGGAGGRHQSGHAGPQASSRAESGRSSLGRAAEGRCVPPSRSADKSSSSWCKTVSSVPASQPTRLVACRLRKPRVAVPVRSAPVAARRASGLRSPRHVPRSRHRLRGTKAQRMAPAASSSRPIACENRCRSAIDGPTRRSGLRVQALGLCAAAARFSAA